MRIGDFELGSRTYIISDPGSNHNGDLETARRLVQASAMAGVDAVKFQLFRADKLYPGTITEGAVPDWWLPHLQEFCQVEGVEFLCSIFCEDTLEAYMRLDPAAIKIASPEATNARLLRAAAAMDVPLIVSTGAMTEEQVEEVVETLTDTDLVLLHCVSAYPSEPEHMNLAVLRQWLVWYGSSPPFGLSDHTLHPSHAPVIAVALGACVIEKHITLDRSQSGPDHPFALEPDMFRVMVSEVRDTEVLLGDGVKRVQPSEDATDRRAA